MYFFWYLPVFHTFLSHSFPIFVWGGTNLYICTQARVSLNVWRLKINNQESTVINPSPYSLRQNISPNPGSLNLTQCLLPNQVSQTNPGSLIQLRVSHPTQGLPPKPGSPNPPQGLVTQLVSLARLLWGSAVSLFWDWIYRQASRCSIHMGSQDPNSGSHAHSVSMLASELSPQPPVLSSETLIFIPSGSMGRDLDGYDPRAS